MRWEHEASESRAVWPYRVRENVIKIDASGQLKNHDDVLTTFSMQNWQTGTGGTLTDGRARWDLFNQDRAWSDALLNLSLSLDDIDSFRQYVLPPGKDAALLFAVFSRCAVTRWRSVVTEPFGNGTANIALTLKRALVRGDIDISPRVILAEDIDSAASEWARNKASIIATGFPIHVWANEPEIMLGGGLDIVWTPFPANCKDALYMLDLPSYSSPVLHMNDCHPVLAPTIQSKSRARNDRTRLRDAIFGFIASDVGMQLARYAVKAAVGEPESEEESEMSEKILNMLSRQIKWPREAITSSFNEDEEQSSTAELHRAIQHHRKLALLLSDAFGGIQEDIPGGD